MTWPGKWARFGEVLQVSRRVHAVSGFANRLVSGFRRGRVLQVSVPYLQYPDAPGRSCPDPLKRYVLPESVEQVPINQTQPRRVRIRTGLRMHAAGLVQTPEWAATGHSKFQCGKSVPQCGTRTQPHYPQL